MAHVPSQDDDRPRSDDAQTNEKPVDARRDYVRPDLDSAGSDLVGTLLGSGGCEPAQKVGGLCGQL